MKNKIISITYIAVLALMLTHCGDDASNPDPSVPTYSISVDTTGLQAALDDVVIRNNGGDDLTMNTNGTYTFSEELEDGAHYNITALRFSDYSTCTVTNGSGNVDGANVKHIKVHCVQ